jgi:hypothetical protein
MPTPSRFEVFRVSLSLAVLPVTPDPRLDPSWDQCSDAEKEEALGIFDRAGKGKMQYFSSTVTDVSDENNPISHSLASQFFDVDSSDGREELEGFICHVAAQIYQRYEQICPVQKTDKRMIEWSNQLPDPKTLRKLN